MRLSRSSLRSRLAALATVVAVGAGGIAACAPSDFAFSRDALQVVTTTSILADMIKEVGGDDVDVHMLIPPGADPHSYEPSLRAIRDVAYADIAFSNQLLLEDQSLINTIDANLPAGVQNVAVAEQSRAHGAHVIPLVENASLDTLWLGMRVLGGSGNSKDTVEIQAMNYTGPGNMSAYITGTFGQPQIYFDTSDGLDDHDVVELPTNAHTHMSWAFTKDGAYTLTLQARLVHPDGTKEILGTSKFTFAVGIDPHSLGGGRVLSSGHVDITAEIPRQGVDGDPASRTMVFYGDIAGDTAAGGVEHAHTGSTILPADAGIIAVPYSASADVPADPAYRFLGRAGEEVYLLAQAVLGKHVHGELDPHMWQDVTNAIAYVEVIRDNLIKVDPSHAQNYNRRAAAYIATLRKLDTYVRQVIATIPADKRNLVTTHDGFGYLAKAYGINVAGFVASNPSMEPSARDMANLSRTLSALHVSAVFLEPNSQSHEGELINLAESHGIDVCTIYSDTLTKRVTTYVDMMVTNADNLKRCLDRTSLGAWPFNPEGMK